MTDFHKIWIKQCEATQGIKEEFGIEKALGYLIGEKLLNFLRMSDDDPAFAEELPEFVKEIKGIFQPWEIRDYLDDVRRLGALGHVCNDEEFETFRAADAIEEDVVTAAEDILLVERMKEMLLD